MATRGTWNIQVKSSGSWGAASTLYRPNDNFPIRKVSTQIKTKLANGSNVFFTPSTKYLDEPLVFVWYEDTSGTIKTQIEGYIDNQSDLKITDDLSNIFYGRFITIDSTRIVGRSDEVYDTRSIFEIIPGLE